MKQFDIIRRGKSKDFAVVWSVKPGGVVLAALPVVGPGVYHNSEVYSVDLLHHFGWRVVNSIGGK